MARRLGQHFLFDPRILDRIVDALDADARDQVLEIGPGRGTLTARLAPRVGRVVVIEKDRRLVEHFPQEIERVTVIHGDALEYDWADLMGRRAFKVCGNVPYAITTPLVDKALREPLVSRVVFLVQREVADRLAASSGTAAYGALSVGVQAVATVERLFGVKAGAFRPPPEVESAVVRLTLRRDPLVADAERQPFRRFVGGIFGQRRKQMRRALRTVTGLPAARVDALLETRGIDPADRAERLSPGTLAALFHDIRATGAS